MVYSGVGHAPPRNAASLVATGFIVMVEFAHFNRDEEEFPMTEEEWETGLTIDPDQSHEFYRLIKR